MVYDSVIMCTGMQNDNKQIENLEKLRKRRDKPVYSCSSMEEAMFAGRHLKGATGNVLFTSQGTKSRDFYLNYSAAMNTGADIKSRSSRETTKVKVLNSDKKVYEKD